MRGQLTEQLPEDGTAEELYQQIQKEKQKLIKAGKIEKEKPLPDVPEEEKPFPIPTSWRWVYLGELFQHNTGKALNSSDTQGRQLEYITTSNLYWNRFVLDGLKTMPFTDSELEKCTVRKGDLLVCEGGDIGRSAVWPYDYDIRIQNHIHRLRRYSANICTEFYYYLLWLYKQTGRIDGIGIGLQGFSSKRVHSLIVPIAPYDEAVRVVEVIKQAFSALDTIDALQAKYADNLTVLKSKLIDAAIQGKLTEQLPEDGTADELYRQIQAERKRQETAGMIKAVELAPDVPETEMPFTIPSSWKWTNLGNVSYIVRGGSPRPIKQYITTREDGINWIKIGDVEKGGKYIYSTHEKIIPEGETKSRRVYPGDFLLTNSMSFGRPYISKIEGCIHDGWLLIHDLTGFDPDYLYYLLSSSYLYGQFTVKASGSTVDNLNIDKVKAALVPLPPLAEQKRIVAKLEELLPLCERLK
jgi:type I restriction enzyme S subunit